MKQTIHHEFRQFRNRIINFVRPQPRFVPLQVSQIFEHKEGLGTVEKFTNLFYSSGTPRDLNWRGLPILKNPCDMWMSIELFQKLKPSVIIETGTHHGGSAAFYADITQTLGLQTQIITIDINPKWSFDPKTKGILSLEGYSTDKKIVEQVRAELNRKERSNSSNVMVFLDSDHSEANVSKELELYHSFVNPGSYLIVEDTHVNGHPSHPTHGPGPYEATQAFLKTHPEFRNDPDCERFLLTYNPKGWLRRVS